MRCVQQRSILFGVADVTAGDNYAVRFIHNPELSVADLDTIGRFLIVAHFGVIAPREASDVKPLRCRNSEIASPFVSQVTRQLAPSMLCNLARRPEKRFSVRLLRTAMASAFFWPISTTSCFPRVTPV